MQCRALRKDRDRLCRSEAASEEGEEDRGTLALRMWVMAFGWWKNRSEAHNV
jgi:hypothetical protein